MDDGRRMMEDEEKIEGEKLRRLEDQKGHKA
jgi:hypothetical protein